MGLDVDIIETKVTADRTATLRVSLTNESDTAKKIGAGHRPVFSAVYPTNQSTRIVLLDSSGDYDSIQSDCWRVDDDEITTYGSWSKKFEPGETKAIDLAVWDTPPKEGNDICMPVGSYQYTQKYTTEYGGEVDEFEWSFSLRLTS